MNSETQEATSQCSETDIQDQETETAEESESASEANRAWVGSDATSNTVFNNEFKNKSEIAIAIAVDDREEFNTKYRNVIEEKSEEHGFSLRRPVLKSHPIKENASEWNYDNILSEFVEELLTIDNILNVHVVITTITNQMVEAYTENNGPREHLSLGDLHKELTDYYHLVAIWDYLEEYREAPWGTTNVLLDDFGGKDNNPWRRIGMISDDLYVIPRGDYTYPILSLADLTLDYVKDNVEEWTETEIRETLIEVTPDDSAYVNTRGIHEPAELEEIVPLTKRNISRSKHYPHPIVFVDRGGIDKEELVRYDIYHTVSEYVYENSGCMKYFSPTEDGKIIKPEEDYIIRSWVRDCWWSHRAVLRMILRASSPGLCRIRLRS